MLRISHQVQIPDSEIEIIGIRAQGAGGQNVNKVSTAVHLRFDIRASSLPDIYKQRLLDLRDQRISKDGVVIIKSQSYRSRVKNHDAALHRLGELIRSVTATKKRRRPTKPTRSSQKRRMDSKTRHGQLKQLRGKVS